MKKMNWGLAAILVWILTIAIFGFRFVKGSTTQSDDGRTAVLLSPSEKSLILFEMRGMLDSVRGVLQGVNQDDMTLVAEAARKSGTAHMADLDPRLMLKLPVAFKAAGVGAHDYFEEVALAADKGATKEEILEMLATQLDTCVTCHAAYRLQEE